MGSLVLTLEIIVGPRVGYENGIWLFSRALPELSSHHISDFSGLCFSDTGRCLVAVLWWVRAFFVFCVASVHWVEDACFLTTPLLNVIRNPHSFCTSALLDSWYEGQSARTEVMECPMQLVLSLTGAFGHWSLCHSIAEAVSVFGMYGIAVISHGIQSLSSLALFGYVWERTVSTSKNFFYKLSVWKNENINDFNKIRVIEKIPKANILPTFLLNTKSILFLDKNGVPIHCRCQTLFRQHNKSATSYWLHTGTSVEITGVVCHLTLISKSLLY